MAFPCHAGIFRYETGHDDPAKDRGPQCVGQYIGNEREPVVVVDPCPFRKRRALVGYAATRSKFAGAASVGIGYRGCSGLHLPIISTGWSTSYYR